jgi:predicted nuclease of restriction endonuclease-like (RecB) superfamily
MSKKHPPMMQMSADEKGGAKSSPRKSAPSPLFDRVVTILEEARGRVVRTVNTGMVTAYWLIGREIVESVQGGEERAEYGKQVVENLSARLTERYGKGFSERNLQVFRQFYLAFRDRIAIPHPMGAESEVELPHTGKSRPPGVEFEPDRAISHPSGREFRQGFSPLLSWSHYRALMRVEDMAARDFYEREAAECGWSKAQLERQIQSSYYQRILANRGEAELLSQERERLSGEPINAGDVLKSPYVLEFLGLPDAPVLHESTFEQVIIDNLQSFLLELGKGFSFVARQKHIRFDDQDFYVDLVFYNFILKCFLLIDLKIGKLTHRDVGQMDGYVRLYEDRFKVPGDNPTIGLILCSDKGEAVAKYSVLSEGRQIFASKYLQFLPSEEELRIEIEKEPRLIEARQEDNDDE